MYIQTSSPLFLRQKKCIWRRREGERERRQRKTEEPKPNAQIMSIFHSFLFGRKKYTSSTAPTTTKIKLPVCKQFLSLQNFFVINSTFRHGLPMSTSGTVGRKGPYFTKRNGKSVLKRRDNCQNFLDKRKLLTVLYNWKKKPEWKHTKF